MSTATYIGNELDLFREARNWKSYYGGLLQRYLGRRVLEVGAGIGATTQSLCQGRHENWTCLEPDPELAGQVHILLDRRQLPDCCKVRVGTLAELGADECYDSILYIDVLEHIEADREEMSAAARHLAPGGFLIVLAPAHNWLFTPFDAAIGHFRRYSKRTLAAAAPTTVKKVRLSYLDSVGMFASLGNRLLLHSSMPTRQQIGVWDRWMVPCSRWVDPLLCHGVGKSVLGVWQQPLAA